ncbi:MAG: hypothetical protein BWY06_02854 [Candidatus Latescibacteria bacterium ADurb.Bin168]|nr:MAG: hypothetical protein BWY06_02854 [Candidatus Latescibacteria bacterium ADurb.Bin168]
MEKTPFPIIWSGVAIGCTILRFPVSIFFLSDFPPPPDRSSRGRRIGGRGVTGRRTTGTMGVVPHRPGVVGAGAGAGVYVVVVAAATFCSTAAPCTPIVANCVFVRISYGTSCSFARSVVIASMMLGFGTTGADASIGSTASRNVPNIPPVPTESANRGVIADV